MERCIVCGKKLLKKGSHYTRMHTPEEVERAKEAVRLKRLKAKEARLLKQKKA